MGERAFEDPELEERRQRALRNVRQLGDPVLRTPSARIEVFDDALRDEAATMIELMHSAHGVGLAAPQLGRLRRLIVIDPFVDEPPIALVNPEITWFSDEQDSFDEGCLSIGEVVVPVIRPLGIRLTARDLDGQEVAMEIDGFGARVVQHEVDHLDGILIIDRTGPEERKEALRQLRAEQS